MNEPEPPIYSHIGNPPMDCPLLGRYPPGMDPVSTLAPALQIIGQRLEHLAGRVDEAIDGNADIRSWQSEMRTDVKSLGTRMGELEERERERNGSIKDMMEWRKSVEQEWRDKTTAQKAEKALRTKYFTNVRIMVGHDVTKIVILGIVALIGGGFLGDVLERVWGI